MANGQKLSPLLEVEGNLMSDQRDVRNMRSPLPVNCFNPPTKASQLRNQQRQVAAAQTSAAVQDTVMTMAHIAGAGTNIDVNSYVYKNEDDEDDEAHETGHSLPPQSFVAL